MKMDKPIILQIKDVKEELIRLMNKSGLPAFFLLQIMHDIERQLIPYEQEELQKASESYSQKKNLKEKKDGE